MNSHLQNESKLAGEAKATTSEANKSGVGDVNEASAAALHSNNKSRSGSESYGDDESSLSQSPLQQPFAASQKTAEAKMSNPPLTWTTDELRLISKMRQGMMNAATKKRPQTDEPKNPLR